MTTAVAFADPPGAGPAPGYQQVEAELAQLCGQLNATYAALVTLTARAIRTGAWAGPGIRSVAHWLVLRAGLSWPRAGDLARLATRAETLPQTLAAMGQGQLSVDQAGVVAAYAPARFEASVADLALDATVPQLRRALSRYVFDVDAEHPADPTDPTTDPPTAAERAAAPAQLSMGYDRGRFTLRYTAPADHAALVEHAVREAKDALFAAGEPHPSLADGLTEVAARSLATLDPPTTSPTDTATNTDGPAAGPTAAPRRARAGRAARYRIYLHLDTAGGWIHGGPPLPDHLLDLLTCDGTLHPLWETEGSPVNVGRARRIVPDHTRRLVEDRDRGCRFPGVRREALVDRVEVRDLRRRACRSRTVKLRAA